ncbi:MAG: c-type cytochrome [Pseudomonadota bacterium]
MRIVSTMLLALAVSPAGAAETHAEGRRIFTQVCSACHANAMSEAPQVKQADAWKPRLAKGRDALYLSALNGFVGASGEEMPPRGGRPDLKDDEVRAAVDYIVFITHQKGSKP